MENNKKTRIVNGYPVETETTEFINANILEVEAGTTGYRGGDTGHGGRTYLRIKDLGCTDMEVYFSEEAGLEIELGGDCELETFIQALDFAVAKYKEQSGYDKK